ncbi:MAG: hypothetical protein JOS17DRAFT_787302 [Linnemannia elongata]|nr:MAG: hypothetical protein JOS17DRAFT_787302 [Linnemannia elongata]
MVAMLPPMTATSFLEACAFIPYLWRSFSEDPSRCPTWNHNLTNAIRSRLVRPQELEWYMEVYRRHAKYIRHLTVFMPVILEACLEDVFEPLAPLLSGDNTIGTSGEGTGTGAETVAGTGPRIAAVPVVSGRSLITNLVSFSNRLTCQALVAYSTTRMNAESRFGTGLDNAAEATTGDPAAAETLAKTTFRTLINTCQRIILCNPRLKTLNCIYTPQLFQELQRILRATGEAGGYDGCARAFRSLRNLSIVTNNGRIPVLPPSVTYLRMIAGFGTRFEPSAVTAADHVADLGHISPMNITNESLEDLYMYCIESNIHLQTILTQAPALKTLTVLRFIRNPDFHGFSSPPAPVSGSWPLSQITVLKFRHNHGFSSACVPAFPGMFKSFPLLVEYYDDIWSLDLATELVEHCPLLEVIRVSQDANEFWSALSSVPQLIRRQVGAYVTDSVSVLLTTLPRLRELAIPNRVVKAENILERPWVCLDLEEFWCQIVEVPYLTEEEEQEVQEIRRREEEEANQQYTRTDKEEELMDLHESCISTRRHIMAQLAKLTSLKYLSFGPDFKARNVFENRVGLKNLYRSPRDGRRYIGYDDVLPDTLHLRLDTGLDQLACLKKLEFISFESIDHRLDNAEIEWMAREFPRLKEMHGLVTQNYFGVEPDPKIDGLIALLRRLRPDVAQRQSFGGYATTTIHTDLNGRASTGTLFGSTTYSSDFY